MSAGLADRAAALLGARVRQAEAVAGGMVSDVLRLVLEDGRQAVVKSGPAPRVEAAMLGALAEAGVPCPAVLAADDAALVIEAMDDDASFDAGAWRLLGHAVRRLHDATGARYGWYDDYAFGAVALDNTPTEDWPTFWAERRLLPGLEAVDPGLARRVEALAGRLGERLPARPAASLLHGDLWVGNVLVGRDGAVALIDPACYHGHAEVDLAMLSLFASPGAAFAEGYGPFEPGLAERRPVYQLFPALVHRRLFGRGYSGLVARLLDEAGA
ncbi:MAG: fructosamine kinase family protein [Paracoccaceae bacterium]